MQYLWIPLILFYGVAKGVREALKKKSMQTCTIIEVLFFYTFFAFLLTIPFSIGQNIFGVSIKYHAVILLKAFIIFVGWICALNAMKKLPLSVYCILDMSRMLFSVLLSIIFLGEAIGVFKGVGFGLVLIGILLVNLKKDNKTNEKIRFQSILLVIISCILNAISAVIDKLALSTDPNRWLFGNELLSDGQMQFWYMLYLTSFYGIYMIIRILFAKERVNVKKCLSCPWIYLLSIIFMLADKAMFIANSSEYSTVGAMTVMQQISVVVTIILGKIIYKEKNIVYRLICAGIIIAGIIISVI